MPKSEKIWRVLASLIVFYILLYLFATNSLNIQGFGPYDSDIGMARPTTVWDWLQLLVIPVILALAAWRLEASERKADRQLADKRADLDREFADRRAQTDHEIAEKRARTDHEIALDRQQQATLEAYYDRMADLLLKGKLRKSKPEDEVRSIARAYTVNVFPILGNAHKVQVLQFLNEFQLITFDCPIIEWKGADLSHADLSSINIPSANLSRANLSHTNLSNANLSRANLSDANLSGAILFHADLSHADLSHATLSSVDFSKTILDEAKLVRANLHNAKLEFTDLSHVSFALISSSGDKCSSSATYNQGTTWPEGFDPQSHGAVLVDDDGAPVSPPS